MEEEWKIILRDIKFLEFKYTKLGACFFASSVYSSTLKMEAVLRSSRTLVNFYQTIPGHIPDHRRPTLHSHLHKDLISNSCMQCYELSTERNNGVAPLAGRTSRYC
jgi:hypothetical protein